MTVAAQNRLEAEFKYFLAHRPELMERYKGRVVVIKNDEVIGVFDDELEAVNETKTMHEPGTFLVQRVEEDESSFTHTYHSRVVFE